MEIEETLTKLFGSFGELLECRIVGETALGSPASSPRGVAGRTGVLRFGSRQVADEVIKNMNGAALGDQEEPLSVRYVESPRLSRRFNSPSSPVAQCYVG